MKLDNNEIIESNEKIVEKVDKKQLIEQKREEDKKRL